MKTTFTNTLLLLFLDSVKPESSSQLAYVTNYYASAGYVPPNISTAVEDFYTLNDQDWMTTIYTANYNPDDYVRIEFDRPIQVSYIYLSFDDWQYYHLPGNTIYIGSDVDPSTATLCVDYQSAGTHACIDGNGIPTTLIGNNIFIMAG